MENTKHNRSEWVQTESDGWQKISEGDKVVVMYSDDYCDLVRETVTVESFGNDCINTTIGFIDESLDSPHGHTSDEIVERKISVDIDEIVEVKNAKFPCVLDWNPICENSIVLAVLLENGETAEFEVPSILIDKIYNKIH